MHRTSVGSEPKQKTKASKDFLLMVLHAHIIEAAKVCCETQDTDDCLICAKKVVSKFVNVRIASSEASDINSRDMAYNYASDLLTLGLLWHGLHDTIREGDGNKILLYWKFLVPIFRQEGHHNYAKEGFLLLAQANLLSERKVTELKWSRTVNMHGRQGCNIAIDLFVEHMNRRLKNMIGSLQSNVNPSTIQRVTKSLGVVKHVCKVFRQEAELYENKGYCSYQSFENNFNKVLKQLEEELVFTPMHPFHGSLQQTTIT